MGLKYLDKIIKRKDDRVHNYEKIKVIERNTKPKLLIEVNLNDHKGNFTIKEIVHFEECKVDDCGTMRKRVNNIRNGCGKFLTLNKAILSPKAGSDDLAKMTLDKEGVERRRILRKRMIEENNEFKNFMKLMPIGSLVEEALIIQSRRPREKPIQLEEVDV